MCVLDLGLRFDFFSLCAMPCGFPGSLDAVALEVGLIRPHIAWFDCKTTLGSSTGHRKRRKQVF